MILDTLRTALLEYHRRAVTVPRAERLRDALARRIGAAASLLDVGCGDGRIARDVARAVGAGRVGGVDVVARHESVIDVRLYDGTRLPYADRDFEVVTVVDVLHHCADPAAVLRETLRVAARAVVVKDHFSFGPASHAILHAMDRVGNARDDILVRGRYFTPAEWVRLVRDAGGAMTDLDWPVRIHDLPWRLVARSELQFVAEIVAHPAAPDGPRRT